VSPITPEIFGAICSFTAGELANGSTQDQALQRAVLEFWANNPVDVEEVVETAAEGWKRLQSTEA